MQGARGSFILICFRGTLMLTGGGSQVWVPFNQTHLGEHCPLTLSVSLSEGEDKREWLYL